MWTEIFVSAALYVVSFGILPLVIRRQHSAHGIAVLALFVAPLVGAATYSLKTQRFSLMEIAAIYPFALFPLGFWAALLGALSTPVLHCLKAHGRVVLIVTAVILGAVIGSVFMFGFVHLDATIQSSSRPLDVSLYMLCGFSAGSIVGLLAAWRVTVTDTADTKAT